jgi:hypothetical protein
MAAQIAVFRSRYRVIAMDSRDQGKSGDSPGKITYEKTTPPFSTRQWSASSGRRSSRRNGSRTSSVLRIVHGVVAEEQAASTASD